ncbi:MAG: rod shape-determining protein MreD [Rectinemataceae bacterium]
MRSVLAGVLFAVPMLFVQSVWLAHGLAYGVVPDLALVILIFASYHNQTGSGIISACITGLVADALSSTPMGYYTFLYTAIAYGAAMLHEVAALDRLVIPFLVASGGTLLKGILSHLLAFLSGDATQASVILSVPFALEMLANGILAVPLFLALDKFKYLFTEHRKSERP